MTCEGFVDRVVHNFEYTVVKTALVSVADIHVRALAHTIKTFEFLDFRRIVDVVFGHIRARFWIQIFGHFFFRHNLEFIREWAVSGY